MKYRNDYGEVFDEDDLFDKVSEVFTRDEFANWVDDNFSGLEIDSRIQIMPSEALDAMGDFESAHEDAIYAIMDDRGGLYPDLSDLGISEVEDEYGESESVRSAMSSAYGRGKVAAGKAPSRARSAASKTNNRFKTGQAATRAKARAKKSKAAKKPSSASKKGVRR